VAVGHGMKKAFLIYNPFSGRGRQRRAQQVAKALAIFRAAGVDAESGPTAHTGSAVAQTQKAVAAGFDTVIACGGDGTANEILNGLMTSNAEAVMGVLPFGSGNVLATELRLPPDAAAAAQALLRYKPRTLLPGLMRYQDKAGPQQRYFVVAAGVGSDAELVYRTHVGAKERYGVYAYFLEMFRMAFRRRFPMFNVEWKDGQGNRHSGRVAMATAVRASKFPGLLKYARLDAELGRNHCALMLIHSNRVWPFLNYFASVMTGMNWKVPQVDLVYSDWFRCTPLDSQNPASIHSEVDGELAGTLPVEVSLDSRTFKLLMPG
jgi:diacylglycerol kinase (ATP)